MRSAPPKVVTVPDVETRTPIRWWEWLFLVAALAAFGAQAMLASPHKSAAFDEQYHLAAGYAYLRTGDFRLATTHPPLMGLIGALGLMGRNDIALPLDDQSWAAGDRFLFSDVFLWEANHNGPQLIVAARRPIIIVGLLLVAAIFLWTRRMLGAPAAWLATLLATFDPNLVSNARVVTTDLGLTCFIFLAVWQTWAWLTRRSPVNLFLAGVCAGLAMGAKYTGLLFWPSAFLILWLYPVRQAGDTVWRRWIGLIGIGVVAYATLWAIYRLDFGPLVMGSLRMPVPAPFYWQELLATFTRIMRLSNARLDFLMGDASSKGWWYYFPVAIGVKTPLPLLVLAVGGVAVIWRRHMWRALSVIWMTPVVFLILGLSGVLTIGFRHILPAAPFLIVLAGNAVNWPGLLARERSDRTGQDNASLDRGRRLALAGGVAFVVWSAADTLSMFPDQEAFFNALAGPWTNWSKILVDSNLDWGQDLPALHDVMAKLGIESVSLAYFGKAVPEAYGVHYRPLFSYLRFVEGKELNAYNPYTPEPGWYAISATSLQVGLMEPESVNLYAYFRDKQPDARAGYSIYLYHVTYPPDMPVDRRVVIGQSAASLSPDQLGIKPGRRVQVKWSQSPDVEIHPVGQPYALPARDDYQRVDANFNDVFTLLGFVQLPTQGKRGEDVHFTLYWQVGTKPMDMPAPTKGSPLSVFLHVTEDDPTKIVTQYDGWQTALRGLEPGDIIVQPIKVDFSQDTKSGSYHLRVGLYSPQDGVRVPVSGVGGPSDHIDLGVLEVK